MKEARPGLLHQPLIGSALVLLFLTLMGSAGCKDEPGERMRLLLEVAPPGEGADIDVLLKRAMGTLRTRLDRIGHLRGSVERHRRSIRVEVDVLDARKLKMLEAELLRATRISFFLMDGDGREKKALILGGDAMEETGMDVREGPKDATIRVLLDETSRARLEKYTSRNRGRTLVMAIDDVPVASDLIRGPLKGGAWVARPLKPDGQVMEAGDEMRHLFWLQHELRMVLTVPLRRQGPWRKVLVGIRCG